MKLFKLNGNLFTEECYGASEDIVDISDNELIKKYAIGYYPTKVFIKIMFEIDGELFWLVFYIGTLEEMNIELC